VRHGWSGDEALTKLAALRRHDRYLREHPAPQTAEQRRLVRDWAQFDPVTPVRHGRNMKTSG
jgi:hypothetical protein